MQDSFEGFILVAAWIHFTLCGITTYYKTESVDFLGLMNSATSYAVLRFWAFLKTLGLSEDFRLSVCGHQHRRLSNEKYRALVVIVLCKY